MRPYNLFNCGQRVRHRRQGPLQFGSRSRSRSASGSFVFNSNFTWSKNMYNWAEHREPVRHHRQVGARRRQPREVLGHQHDLESAVRQAAAVPGDAPRVGGSAHRRMDDAVRHHLRFAHLRLARVRRFGSFRHQHQSADCPTRSQSLRRFRPDHLTSGSTRRLSPCRQRGTFGNATPNSLEGYGINVQHLSLAKGFQHHRAASGPPSRGRSRTCSTIRTSRASTPTSPIRIRGCSPAPGRTTSRKSRATARST